MDYPYNSAQLLTDTVFALYGGDNGGSSAAQRAAAYLISERQMTEHIGAFLKPTIVTGTYLWATADPLQLEFGYVSNILSVSLNSAGNVIYNYTPDDVQHYVMIRNARAGFVDILCTPIGWSNCSCSPLFPYTIALAYQSGLLTGTSSQPDILLALTLGAQIMLNEIDHLNLSNEGVADIGIQEFSNSFYHEIRTKLGHSAFGSSATANMITRLTKHLRANSALRFH